MNKENPCLKFACAIQKCLELNAYEQSKCLDEIAELKLCCFTKVFPQKKDSVSCSNKWKEEFENQ
jgi:hypothetical protein